MKILFTRFPLESIPHGGAETQVMNLATGLAERGHAVAFVGNCPALEAEFQDVGLTNAQLHIGPPPVTKFSALAFAWRKKKMRARLSNMLAAMGRLDVIIMLSLTEKLLLTDLAAERGIKVVWIEHDPVGPWLTRNPWLRLLKKQSALATTVTVSELSRLQYLEMDWPTKKTIAIPNGIADTWFKEKPAAEHVREKRKEHPLHLGCVARLAKEKGIDVLLRAMAHDHETTLDIVGEGPDEARLRKIVVSLSLTNRVRFFPRRTDLPDFYRTLDALVLPSRTLDPFGMVVAEAMAMGVPCLVTDACGIAGYLRDGKDAVIVKEDSIRALAAGLEALEAQSDRDRIGKAGAATARKLFRTASMVDEYEKILKMA